MNTIEDKEINDILERREDFTQVKGRTIRKVKTDVQKVFADVQTNRIIERKVLKNTNYAALKRLVNHVTNNGQTETLKVKCLGNGNYLLMEGQYLFKALRILKKESVICEVVNPNANVLKAVGLTKEKA